MLFGKTFCCQKPIANRAREGDVNDPVRMDVSDFCTPKADLPASEAVWVNRYLRPRRDFLFEFVQVIHHKIHLDFCFDD
jgi:hypothetical protein